MDINFYRWLGERIAYSMALTKYTKSDFHTWLQENPVVGASVYLLVIGLGFVAWLWFGKRSKDKI